MHKNTNPPMDILLRQMDFWYKTPLGAHLSEAEQKELNKYLPKYFGQHLLQVGGASESFLFEKSPISHRVRLSPEHAPVFRGPSVQGVFQKLPFLPESIDVLLLPHVLEFMFCPEKLIKESYDVLASEGHLVLLGFNPFSLWGLFKYVRRQETLPWRGNFIRISQVLKWLNAQGFVIEEMRTLFFRPPASNISWLRKLIPLEIIGRIFWANCGGIYFIVAKKRIISPIMIENKSTGTSLRGNEMTAAIQATGTSLRESETSVAIQATE